MESNKAADSSRTDVQRGALSASMVAIMDSQVAEMRSRLMRFKVCAPSDANSVTSEALPPHADILIFGPTGSGKSSLIRTFYRALHGTKEVPPDFAERIIVKDTAMNEGTLKYVSAVIKNGKAVFRGGQASSAILCHDTRGHIWMDEKEQKQLSIIMDGGIKDGSVVQQRNYRYARQLWEFWKRDVDLFPPEILNKRNGLSTKPHALLFVFDGSMEEIPDGEEGARFYRDIISMARAKGHHQPQVVLTRIDRVEECLAKAAVRNSTYDLDLQLRQVLDKKIEDVVRTLGVGRSSVHFIENYHTGSSAEASGRNVSVDFHALKVLVQCCSYADVFLAEALRASSRPSPCQVQ